MLRKIRIGVVVLVFILITSLFIDSATILSRYVHWVAQIQLIPAVIAGSVIYLVIIGVLTLLTGRTYCSFICPLGIFQDIISRISKWEKNNKLKYGFKPANNRVRYSILIFCLIAFILNYTIIVGLLAPYSIFGRMLSNMFKPLYIAVSHSAAKIAGLSLPIGDSLMPDLLSLSISVLFFTIICISSWLYGRIYCNLICPVGTLLGLFSRFSIFKIRFNTEACNQCGLCSLKCKSSCIDSRNMKIDYSRCVACFNCISVCKKKRALSYTYKSIAPEVKTESRLIDQNRRRFIISQGLSFLAISSMLASSKILLGSNKPVISKRTSVSPPGSQSISHLSAHCTACHLCISSCPQKILKPALMEYGLEGIMQPVMAFNKGYCDFECTVCSDICPTNALIKLTVKEKQKTQVGKGHYNKQACLVITQESNCGLCSDYCPTKSIRMISYSNGLKIPSIDETKCIGCGACEFICPAKPNRAIFVEGNYVHQQV